MDTKDINTIACSLPLPYEYSKYPFYSSFFIGASSLLSLYYQDYSSFAVIFVLFLSSINYWSNTVDGFGRHFDLNMCRFFALYFYIHCILYKDEVALEIYKYGILNAMFLFCMEYLFYYLKNPKWIVIHIGIHFYCICTPFVLYFL